MEIRGRRECRNCATQWSYYDTGEVACPACGSLRSRGVDERTRHTDAAVELDLTGARTLVDEEGIVAAVVAAGEDAREYVRRRGFVHAGDLRPLTDGYLAAAELGAVGRWLDRPGRTAVDDAEEVYLLGLLGGADRDERPSSDRVPASLAPTRGLAYAGAVDDYREDVRTFLDEDETPPVRRLLERLDDHVRRVEALDGSVPPADAERLVRAAQDAGRALRTGEEPRLATACDRLEAIGN